MARKILRQESRSNSRKVPKFIEAQIELPPPPHEAFSKTPFEYNTNGGYPAIPTSMANINPVQGGVINTNSIRILYRRTKSRYDWAFSKAYKV
jgi:hypothetical protein